MHLNAGSHSKAPSATGAPPSALAARTGSRAYDEDCVHPVHRPLAGVMGADAVTISPAARPEAAAPAPQKAARRPSKDRSQIPDEVRDRHPHLEPALGKALRVEDYHLEGIRAHVGDLAMVPEGLLAAVRKRGLRDVHIANRTVPELDSNQKLRDKQPRGWKEGATWNDVPGAYNPNSRSVVAGAGGHGSHSLILHELGHAVGGLLRFDKHKGVIEAHKRLFDKLPPYLRQDGPGGFAGRQEMFAEAFATYLKEGEAAVAREFDPAFAAFLRDVVMTMEP